MRTRSRVTTMEVVGQPEELAGGRSHVRPDPVQILHMADMLSDGLVAQFPNRFA